MFRQKNCDAVKFSVCEWRWTSPCILTASTLLSWCDAGKAFHITANNETNSCSGVL